MCMASSHPMDGIHPCVECSWISFIFISVEIYPILWRNHSLLIDSTVDVHLSYVSIRMGWIMLQETKTQNINGLTPQKIIFYYCCRLAGTLFVVTKVVKLMKLHCNTCFRNHSARKGNKTDHTLAPKASPWKWHMSSLPRLIGQNKSHCHIYLLSKPTVYPEGRETECELPND